jgi:hypothetical protein
MKRIAAGIQQEWILKERISAYTLTDITVNSQLALSESVIESVVSVLLHTHRVGILFDISAPGVSVPFLALTGQNVYNIGLTPQGQQRIKALLDDHPLFRAYVAIIVSTTLSGKITSSRSRHLNDDDKIIAQIFHHRDTGSRWLTEQINLKA